MKMKSYISAVAIAVLAMGFNSCTKDFDEINTDPDAYSTAPVSNILGYTIYQIASNYGDEHFRLSDWSGYMANSQIEGYQYLPTHNEFGYRWYTTYTCIPQLQDILDRTTPEENKNMQNVALLLQQYLLFLAAVLFPRARVLFFFFIPMRMPIAVMVFIVIELFDQIAGLNGGVAHLVHLSSIAVAWLYCLVRFRVNPIQVWKENL